MDIALEGSKKVARFPKGAGTTLIDRIENNSPILSRCLGHPSWGANTDAGAEGDAPVVTRAGYDCRFLQVGPAAAAQCFAQYLSEARRQTWLRAKWPQSTRNAQT